MVIDISTESPVRLCSGCPEGVQPRLILPETLDPVSSRRIWPQTRQKGSELTWILLVPRVQHVRTVVLHGVVSEYIEIFEAIKHVRHCGHIIQGVCSVCPLDTWQWDTKSCQN